jgi:hypothetical protein
MYVWKKTKKKVVTNRERERERERDWERLRGRDTKRRDERSREADRERQAQKLNHPGEKPIEPIGRPEWPKRDPEEDRGVRSPVDGAGSTPVAWEAISDDLKLIMATFCGISNSDYSVVEEVMFGGFFGKILKVNNSYDFVCYCWFMADWVSWICGV